MAREGKKDSANAAEETARPGPAPPGAPAPLADALDHNSWAEKYRPAHLEDIVGNSRALSELRKWAEDWEHGHPVKKAVILAGAPGTGKTSAAFALASDMRWGVLELNASDSRNYAAIKKVAFSGAVHDTFSDAGEFISSKTGRRKLIILDEADSLYEGVEKMDAGPGARDLGDKGGKRAIVETVAKTHQPVLLIVNDSYGLTGGGGEALKSLCIQIKFERVHRNSVRAALRRICDLEGISSTPEALDELSGRSGGDLRAAVNDLQSLCAGTRSLRLENLKSLGGRDERTKIFEVMVDILKGSSVERARNSLRKLDEAPEFVLLWLDENLPIEYRHPDDLARGFDMLSRADVFLGRVSRRQQYGLWAYASDLMSAGVAMAKRQKYREFNRYRFPMWLLRRSRMAGTRRLEKGMLAKIGSHVHQSTYDTRHDAWPLFRLLFENDMEFGTRFTRELALEPEELSALMGVESTNARVRQLLEAAGQSREEKKPTVREFKAGKWDTGDDEELPKPAKKGKAPKKKSGKGTPDEDTGAAAGGEEMAGSENVPETTAEKAKDEGAGKSGAQKKDEKDDTKKEDGEKDNRQKSLFDF